VTDYSEHEFVIPSLQFMRLHPSGITTTQLIEHLTSVFQPTDHDADIINGRNDSYFSQKVRNLKSHNTFEKDNLATYSNGIWTITLQGRQYVASAIIPPTQPKPQVSSPPPSPIATPLPPPPLTDATPPEDLNESMDNQGFAKEKVKKEKDENYEGLIIEEGSLDKRTIIQRERSGKLREIAISEFKKGHGGKLFCAACGFDFHETYGETGKGLIEIHHTEPMHLKDIQGETQTIEEALTKVVTVCPNCHRIIHHTKGTMLTIEAVKSLISDKKQA
jgi:hypothetical protein